MEKEISIVDLSNVEFHRYEAKRHGNIIYEHAAKLERRAFPKHEAIQPGDMKREFKRQNNEVFFAITKHELLLGYAIFARKSSKANLIKLFVHRDYRRKGIGSGLIHMGIDLLKQQNCQVQSQQQTHIFQ